MTLKLAVSSTVPVRVKGTIPGPTGAKLPFDFTLHCTRLAAEELRALNESDARLTDVLLDRTHDWEHVLDDDNAPLPFSQDSLRQLLNIVGMATLVFLAYVEACGAKGREKN